MNPSQLPVREPEDTLPEDSKIAALERRILILAPTGNDARLTAEFLDEAQIISVCLANIADLCRKVTEGCGAVVLAEEVVSQPAAVMFFPLLRQQPAWSDVPIILITTGGAAGADRIRRLADLGMQGNVTVLERPFRPATLVSTLKVALRSRDRQYEVRRLLIEISQARDAAEQASHAKDEFLAALSHELRTPLNPVLLLASESAIDESLPATVRRDFDLIARSVTLEARLIDDLLDLTRIKQGKLILDLATVDAHRAIRAALETTDLELSEKQLSVEVVLNAVRADVRADLVRVQQVLWNILKNAAKFTPTGGKIRIETEVTGSELVIRISDNGVGMEAEELARVFGAFVQGNHAKISSGHRFGGLGLGLAISRRLMELHHGSIEATSEGPNRGSTFIVKFPLVEVDGSALPPAKSVSNPPFLKALANQHLLLVEDHQATRLSLQRLLERRGYLVNAVGTLAEARTALASQSFELLLSDLGLPDGSGYELMAELKGRSTIKGIALSGYGMESDLVKSRETGFAAHLTKPVTIHALDAALTSVMAAR